MKDLSDRDTFVIRLNTLYFNMLRRHMGLITNHTT